MKISTNQLRPGHVVTSGETIVRVTPTNRSTSYRAECLVVLQRKDGSRRVARWGKYTRIGVIGTPANE
jgi:hypothetical protein